MHTLPFYFNNHPQDNIKFVQMEYQRFRLEASTLQHHMVQIWDAHHLVYEQSDV